MSSFLFEVWAHYAARKPEAELLDTFLDYAPAAKLRRHALDHKLCDDARVNVVAEEDFTPLQKEIFRTRQAVDAAPAPDMDAALVAENQRRTMQITRNLQARLVE